MFEGRQSVKHPPVNESFDLRSHGNRYTLFRTYSSWPRVCSDSSMADSSVPSCSCADIPQDI